MTIYIFPFRNNIVVGKKLKTKKHPFNFNFSHFLFAQIKILSTLYKHIWRDQIYNQFINTDTNVVLMQVPYFLQVQLDYKYNSVKEIISRDSLLL